MIDTYMVTFTVDARLMYAFRAFLVLAAIIPIIVAWQTDRDHACKQASPRLQDVRRAGFIITSCILWICAACFSIETMMAAIFFGAINFVCNSIALRQREKHPPNSRTPVHALGGRRVAFRPLMFGEMSRKNNTDH
jgi:hypothetical protein